MHKPAARDELRRKSGAKKPSGHPGERRYFGKQLHQNNWSTGQCFGIADDSRSTSAAFDGNSVMTSSFNDRVAFRTIPTGDSLIGETSNRSHGREANQYRARMAMLLRQLDRPPVET